MAKIAIKFAAYVNVINQPQSKPLHMHMYGYQLDISVESGRQGSHI